MGALKTLESKAREDDGYKHCTLMLDAMAVKQQIDYNQKNKKMVGFIDLGDGADATDEAKEALVFMAVGLRGYWKMPIAYFFTRTLTASAQKELLTYALQYLHEAGLIVHGVTMDGHASNVAMCKMMGCDLRPFHVKSGFVDPASKRTVYVLFDACHMLKLCRNMLEAYGLLESKEGRIYWQHIEDLQNLQVIIHSTLTKPEIILSLLLLQILCTMHHISIACDIVQFVDTYWEIPDFCIYPWIPLVLVIIYVGLRRPKRKYRIIDAIVIPDQTSISDK